MVSSCFITLKLPYCTQRLSFNSLITTSQFYHFDRRDYLDVVVKKGFRPSIDSSLPFMIRTIIRECWDEDPAKRPPFERISVLLKAEYQAMVSGDMLDHSAKLIDKSTRSFRARVRNTKEQFNGALEDV